MRAPPIPQRIPPLTWRGPSFIWTPTALAAAVGWPAALFFDQPRLQQLTLTAGAVVFALALITLGASWALGRAPRTRRAVVLHVLAATAIAALVAPLVLTQVLPLAPASAVASPLSLAVTPMALVFGLPMALISGLVFALIALERQKSDGELAEENILRPNDVQPFR